MDLKIIKIAGIVFAIVFIGLMAVVMGVIMNKGNNASSKMNDTLSMTDTFDLSTYENGSPIIGEAVRNAISNGKTIGGTGKLVFIVKTSASTTETIYGYATTGTVSSGGSGGSSTGFGKGKNDTSISFTWSPASAFNGTFSNTVTDADYINPSASFKCDLLVNNNDVIVGIYFEQQGDGT